MEVLKLLQKSYHGKIKIIYIDPPYNTGKDFVYKDNFRDNLKNYLEVTGQLGEEGQKLSTNSEMGGRYHSDWLSMMYPRLKLARNLLTDDGVIFISIDDNEVENLKKICDEIFGEEKVKLICVKMSEASGLKMGTVKKQGTIPKLKEYIVVIKKNGLNNFKFENIKKDKWDTEYNIFLENFTKDDKIKIDEINESKDITKEKLEVLDKIAQKIKLVSVSDKIKKLGILSNEKENWLYSNSYRICQCATSSSVLILANEKKKTCKSELFFVASKNNEIAYFVRGNYSNESSKPRLQLIFAEDNLTQHPGDIWTDIKTTGLDNEGGVPFKNGKKPIKLLTRLIKSVKLEKNKDIILDFFSGSATTAHAVMQLNAEDGGNRKYIMVQLPENLKDSLKNTKDKEIKKSIEESINFLKQIDKPLNICEIGKERIRRAGAKIKADESLLAENREKLDIGFKVFKLDSSNIKEWDSETEDLKQSLFDSVDNIKSDRTSLDVLYEIILKYGLELTVPIEEKENFYSISGGTLLINLAKEINMEIIDLMCEEYKNLLEVDEEFKTTVILRDSSFKDDVDKINAMKKLEQVGIKEIRSI
ncbi:site-specific DNA-methyltransferase [Fusobacterium varium]|uniref:site-specific DNA-methyltransferase n=1 Tax=Fusobacterium varium TaxID=856 RepID=UPI0022E75FED|nr:site-specific DNA-methyltransferase [Fusobacterium varium]